MQLPNKVSVCLLFGLGFQNVGFPGIMPLSIAKMIFISPEIPAVGSLCPMFDLI